MNFEEAGAVLRSEREKRNLSIEDVAEELKISPRQLRALESGDVDSLPHQAYAKGFIRSYAAWLGLRPEDLRMQKPQNAEGEGEEELVLPKDTANTSYKVLWLLIILACIAGFIYYAWQENFWNLFDKGEEREIEISESLPTADNYLAKKDMENAEQQAAIAVPAKEPEQIKPDLPISAPVELPESKPALPSASAEISAEPPSPIVSPAASEQAPAEVVEVKKEEVSEENHKLIITAIEECWVHSNSDKTDTRQFSLRKGDTFALTFTDSLELKLGNAGGVRLRYDGRDMPPAGTSGQVKTIVFPPKAEND